MVQLMGETMPKGNRMVTNLYHTRKSIQNLGLGCLKVNCCLKGCMLCYNENSDKTITMCFKIWYFPLIPRLKRLYYLIATTFHMRWHSENERDSTILCHPFDGEA
ncbi:hypothetical protein CR513_61518, partial [Mucuna pruriens]